jgi:hypothetical protein
MGLMGRTQMDTEEEERLEALWAETGEDSVETGAPLSPGEAVEIPVEGEPDPEEPELPDANGQVGA